MTRVNIKGATARLPELVDHVEHGERFTVARNGMPVVEPMPYARRASRARAAFQGSMKGRIDMSRFDEADEEIAREFGMLD